MKISKKLLLENPDKTIIEVFPELFEMKLEVGKWYKTDFGDIINYTGDLYNSYGISFNGYWYDNGWIMEKSSLKPAKHEEVETVLIKEAEKRGLISDKPLYYKLPYGVGYSRYSSKKEFIFKDNKLYLENFDIFNNGQWAKIIETITKEEAEKILNKKII